MNQTPISEETIARVKARAAEIDRRAHELGVMFIASWVRGLNPIATKSEFTVNLDKAGVWRFTAEKIEDDYISETFNTDLGPDGRVERR